MMRMIGVTVAVGGFLFGIGWMPALVLWGDEAGLMIAAALVAMALHAAFWWR